MKIAILALQGAFAEHEQMFRKLGSEATLIRSLDDFNSTVKKSPSSVGGWSGVVIPGGESTAMMRIMKDLGLFAPLRQAILGGMPVFGTCAGLIMLDKSHLDVMDIKAKRNAYGRQLGSFQTTAYFENVGEISMTFIRAPYIESVSTATILAEVDGKAVAAQEKNQLALAFHPELDNSMIIHQYFLEMCR